MRLELSTFLASIGLLTAVSTAHAETIVQNDSLEDMFSGTSSTARLIEGEMYEAVFQIPEAWLPVEMLGVRVVMVKSDSASDPDCPAPCANACGRFGIDVWDEGANPSQTDSCIIANVRYKDPGNQIFTQDAVIDPQTQTVLGFEVRGDAARGSATFKDLRFSTINQVQGVTINPIVLTTTEVRVAVRALDLQCTAGGQIGSGDHFPVLISDLDGVGRGLSNFVYGQPEAFGSPICTSGTEQHYVWEDFAPAFQSSQPGDFIMRLILNRDDPTNPDPDMGMADMGADMSSADMGNNTGDMSSSDMSTPVSDLGTDMSGGEDTGGNNNGFGAEIVVRSVTPDSANNDASAEIAVIGEGFASGAEVLLDARKIGVTETQSERILATVPEGLDPGTYDLVVTNPDGATDILMDGFTVTVAGDSSSGGVGDGGCCAQVPASRGSSQGSALAGLLLAGLFATRRRRNR